MNVSIEGHELIFLSDLLSKEKEKIEDRMADQYRWNNTEFILGYEVKLSASHPVFDICDYMTGTYPKNFVFTGWHVQCFCYTVPILPSKSEFSRYLSSGFLPKKNYVKNIPPVAAGYVRKKQNKLLSYSSRPYWLKDNFTIDGNNLKLKTNLK